MNIERIVKIVGGSLQIYLFVLTLGTLIFLVRDISTGPSVFTIAYAVLPFVSISVLTRDLIYGRSSQKEFAKKCMYAKNCLGHVYSEKTKSNVPVIKNRDTPGEAETRKIGRNYIIFVNPEKILDRFRNNHSGQIEYQDAYDSIIEHEKSHVELYKYFPKVVTDIIKWNSRIIVVSFILGLVFLVLFLGPSPTQERVANLMVLIHWLVIVFIGWFLFPIIEASVLLALLELTCDLKAVERAPRLKKVFLKLRSLELREYSQFIRERWKILLLMPQNLFSLLLRRFSLKATIELIENEKISIILTVWFGLFVFHMCASILLWSLTDLAYYPVVGEFLQGFFSEKKFYVHLSLGFFLPALAIRYFIRKLKYRMVSSVTYLSLYSIMVTINHMIVNWFTGGLVRVIEESLMSMDQFLLFLLSIQSKLVEIFGCLNHFYPLGTLLCVWLLFLIVSSAPLIAKMKNLVYLLRSK